MDNAKSDWVEELPNIVWSYRTTPRKETGKSPFSLCFGLEALILAEVRCSNLRNNNFNLEHNDQLLRENLILIDNNKEEPA